MKQMRLPSQRKTVLSERISAYESNLELARIILADPKRYDGLQREWARAVLASGKGTG